MSTGNANFKACINNNNKKILNLYIRKIHEAIF